MLTVERLSAGYGGNRVLFDLDLHVGKGEAVTLMGRNGMGKTTTVRALMGILRPTAGSIRLDGVEIGCLPPHRVARAGLGLVPEGRQVFPSLTVEENLIVTARPGPWTLARLLDLFPPLAARARTAGGRLSGGEQQMLAIGRALLINPRLLILDEATEGLAPALRGAIWTCLGHLKREGLAILVIDKHVQPLLELADRHFVIEKGRVAWQGTSAELRAVPERVERLLGV
jgi:branched-chain amino acid transport system ATP-binding protein